MARVSFNSIFQNNEDGSLSPLQAIRVGGIQLNTGVRFTKGVSFGGIDFTQFTGRDLEIETDGDVLVIKGIYGQN